MRASSNSSSSLVASASRTSACVTAERDSGEVCLAGLDEQVGQRLLCAGNLSRGRRYRLPGAGQIGDAGRLRQQRQGLLSAGNLPPELMPPPARRWPDRQRWAAPTATPGPAQQWKSAPGPDATDCSALARSLSPGASSRRSTASSALITCDLADTMAWVGRSDGGCARISQQVVQAQLALAATALRTWQSGAAHRCRRGRPSHRPARTSSPSATSTEATKPPTSKVSVALRSGTAEPESSTSVVRRPVTASARSVRQRCLRYRGA